MRPHIVFILFFAGTHIVEAERLTKDVEAGFLFVLVGPMLGDRCSGADPVRGAR